MERNCTKGTNERRNPNTFSIRMSWVCFLNACQIEPSNLKTVSTSWKSNSKIISRLQYAWKRKTEIAGNRNIEKCTVFQRLKIVKNRINLQQKAWMTSDTFKYWIQTIDKCICIANRRIILIVDNRPAHPSKVATKMKNVSRRISQLAKLQLMNQEFIKNLKSHYKKKILIKFVLELKSNQNLQFSEKVRCFSLQ